MRKSELKESGGRKRKKMRSWEGEKVGRKSECGSGKRKKVRRGKEVGRRNAEVGKKESGNAECGRWERKKVRRWEKAGLSNED
jgi:hypothetical protein